tara:strand:- start:176 stop:961 length:786 start_codon:yes stop_codon:yes gene_type:complete
MFFLTIYYKKETFTQCQDLTIVGDGICKPYYGVPQMVAINPYLDHGGEGYTNLSTDQTNSAERKTKNKEAARKLCDNTPGCGGITQKSNGQNSAFLCKKEWNGVDLDDSFLNYETYKCDNHKMTNSTLPARIVLRAGENTYKLKKNFNSYSYKKHENYKFKDADLIKINDDSNEKIKFHVECSQNDIDHFVNTNFNKYIDFANTMDNCMGFHIKKFSTGYEVYFGGKTNNEVLKLDDSETTQNTMDNIIYVTYTAIFNKIQ